MGEATNSASLLATPQAQAGEAQLRTAPPFHMYVGLLGGRTSSGAFDLKLNAAAFDIDLALEPGQRR